MTSCKNCFTKHIYSYENNDNWSIKQSYIALGMTMYLSSILNSGLTPMKGFLRDKIKELFLAKKNMSKDERVSVSSTLGYPKSKSSCANWGKNYRVRKPFAEKFTFIH